MDAEQFAAKLDSLDACTNARAWAKGKTLIVAWQECQRPDWMLWLLGRSTVGKRVIATIAVEFAEQCVHNASGYPAVAECIAVTRRFIEGVATQEELSAALSAAESAAESARSAAESAAESAARSVAAAAAAALSAAAWSAESAAAAWSESAAVWSAVAAAAAAAARDIQCDTIRRRVPDISKFLS